MRVAPNTESKAGAVLAVDGFRYALIDSRQVAGRCGSGNVGSAAAVGFAVYVDMGHGIALVETQLEIMNDACTAYAPAYSLKLTREK